MPEEKKLTKQEVLNVRYAWLGDERIGFKGLSLLNIPAGKFGYNVAKVGKVATTEGDLIIEELNKIRQLPDKVKIPVEEKEFLNSESDVQFLKLSATSLEKVQGIVPMHLQLIFPLIEGDFTKE